LPRGAPGLDPRVEVEGLTGAAHGERHPDQLNHRNGYRD
jgi:hypothetical protein